MRQLLAVNDARWRDARVELHRRLAFPAACLVFALVAVPLGSQPRRGGRAAGSLIAVIVIAAYYLVTLIGAGQARQGVFSPASGIWSANILLAILGLALLPRMEQFRSDKRWLRPDLKLRRWARLLRRRTARVRTTSAKARVPNGSNGETALTENGVPSLSFPKLMDLYVLRRFFAYFAMLLATFVFLFEAFTFFELLDDIAKHHVAFLVVVDYFRFFSFYLLYNLAPLAALVAVLVTLGVMSKNNEIVACKASGMSLYRLAIPLLVAGLTLAGSLIVLDETYLPYANQRQDALRNQIKGRPAQTYAQPQRWIFGENAKIYNYDLFDPAENLFGGLSVIEIDPRNFEMRRRIFAQRAKWSETPGVWELENAWVRDFSGSSVTRYERFAKTSLAELSEPPSYFNREVYQASQMNLAALRRYIEGLHTAGFDVAALTVQWHVKLAFPLIAPISILLALPFALLVGTRGAVGGVALGVGIGIAYWSLARLLEAMGGVGQLPPLFAAWSTDMTFFFLGLYFFFKMPT